MQFQEDPRLRASPRHGGAVRCLQIYVQTLIRRGGAPSGAVGFIANNQKSKPSTMHICLILFSGEILTIFISTLFQVHGT